MVDLLDHYRADDADVEPGVYRVVGLDASDGDGDGDGDEDGDGDGDGDGISVTLLRVVEGGRRVNSGDVVTIDRGDLDALDQAVNPDTGLGKLRQVPQVLAAHPVVAAVALLAVAVGGYLRYVEGVGAGGFAVAAGLIALWFLLR